MKIICENQIKTIFEIDRSGELFRRLLNIFEIDIPLLVLDLESALKRQDFSNAKKISHSIKSSSLNMGAAELATVAGELEINLDSNKNLEIVDTVKIKKCFQYTVAELRGHLNLCKS